MTNSVVSTSILGDTSVIATSPVTLLKVKCLPCCSLPLRNEKNVHYWSVILYYLSASRINLPASQLNSISTWSSVCVRNNSNSVLAPLSPWATPPTIAVPSIPGRSVIIVPAAFRPAPSSQLHTALTPLKLLPSWAIPFVNKLYK